MSPFSQFMYIAWYYIFYFYYEIFIFLFWFTVIFLVLMILGRIEENLKCRCAK